MFDLFFLIFAVLGLAIAVLCYRCDKESERTWQRNKFMHRSDGNRTHGERRF